MEKFNTDDNNVRFIIESAMAKMEKANARLWIICIILIVALIGTNVGWFVYESQYEDVVTSTQTITQELDAGEGGNAIINDGVHINGESEANGD